MGDSGSMYMALISGKRAMRLTDEESLAGETLLSFETGAESMDFFSYVHGNFSHFLAEVRKLKPREQDYLLAYYLLAKTQTSLADIHQNTQTLISSALRRAEGALGCIFMFGQVPSEEQMRKVLEAHDMDQIEIPIRLRDKTLKGRNLPVPNIKCRLSKIFATYDRTRSYSEVSRLFDVPPPFAAHDDRCHPFCGRFEGPETLRHRHVFFFPP